MIVIVFKYIQITALMAAILDISAFENLKNANNLYFRSNLILTFKMTFKEFEMWQNRIHDNKLVRKDILYVALRCSVLYIYIFSSINIYITGLMAAILNFTPKRGFPQGIFGWGLCVVLNSSTKSNYVEKHLLIFVTFKYFGICALKKCKLFTILGLICPWPWKWPQFYVLWNLMWGNRSP